jgi:hypothetical protein
LHLHISSLALSLPLSRLCGPWQAQGAHGECRRGKGVGLLLLLLLPAEPEPEATPECRDRFWHAVGVSGGGTEYIAAARHTTEQPRPLLLILLRTGRRHRLLEDVLCWWLPQCVAVGAPTAEQRAAHGVEGREHGCTRETTHWFHSTKQPTPTCVGVGGIVSKKATRGRLLTLLLLGVPEKAPPSSWLALLHICEESAGHQLGLLLLLAVSKPRTGTLHVRAGATAETLTSEANNRS